MPVQAADKTLRFVPHAEPKVLDPVQTTANITHTHSRMVYDTLFGSDENFDIQPQMVDTFEASKDNLKWTFKLRDGLMWHDGKKVTAEDCVASLNRWGKKDSLGSALYEKVTSVDVVDEKTFTITLSAEFPMILYALGNLSGPPYMMPKNIAMTDADTAITDYTGSGPFIFKKDEWKPGSKLVYVKNEKYAPRSEPSSLTAGGKNVYVDRVEYLIMPDSTTKLAALQNGEIDIWELVPSDMLPILNADENIKSPLAWEGVGVLRMNHLLPPFNDPKVRRAVMLSVDQSVYLAAVSSDPKLGKTCYSLFPCGTKNENNANADLMKSGNLEEAKKLIKESSYDGTKVVVLHTTDIPLFTAYGLVTAERLRAIGLNVDLQTMDWGTLTTRRASREPVDKGGWNLLHTVFPKADIMNPLGPLYSGDPENGWFGWPTDKETEDARKGFLFAKDDKERLMFASKIQERLLEIGAWASLGITLSPMSYRKNLTGVYEGSTRVLWDIKKD